MKCLETAMRFEQAAAMEADGGAWFVRVPMSSWGRLGLPKGWLRRLLPRPEQCYARVWQENGQWFAEATDFARDYVTSVLPALDPAQPKPPGATQDLLLKLYSEVGSDWRVLTDVRFKLMTLLPTVSVVAWGVLLPSRLSDTWQGAVTGLLVSSIGVWVVSALKLYDRRNDELYDDLISRGRRIEKELGVHTGIFLGRRRSRYLGPNHGQSTERIYSAATVGWWLVVLWFLARGVLHARAALGGDAASGGAGSAMIGIPRH